MKKVGWSFFIFKETMPLLAKKLSKIQLHTYYTNSKVQNVFWTLLNFRIGTTQLIKNYSPKHLLSLNP